MVVSITHSKVSTLPDGADTDLVRPSDWNDDHDISGLNVFATIAVSGQSDVVAESSTDTLTFVAGTGMVITTDATTDTITFESSGGSPAFDDLASGTNTTAAMVVGTGASMSASGSGTIASTSCTGNAATATKLATGRTIAISGDLTYTSSSFDGSANVTAAGTLATVNANVGSFGSATASPTYTVNGKGLITAAADVTITPAVGSITGLGTGVATALAINIGTAGSAVVNGGALGTPSSGVATNLTGTAASLTAGTSNALVVTPAPADVTASGVTMSLTAGENLAFGEIVYIKADGKMWKADANAAGLFPASYMAIATISADAAGLFLKEGYARNDTWAWTVGGKIYLSTTAGAMTQTAPTATDDCIQVLGSATHADRIDFTPSPDYMIHV